jgi:RES domain-containing protein
MHLYRISRARYIRDLSGEGARRFGGRWNRRGVPVLYTSAHESLAVLEVLANTPVSSLPDDLQLITLSVPDTAKTEEFKISDLPEEWNSYPPPNLLREMGTEWILSEKSLVLKVPSAIICSEYNYLINPNHADIQRVTIKKIKDFNLSSRVLS